MTASPCRILRALLPGRSLWLGLALALAAKTALAQAPEPVETTLKNMLAATQANSLPDFIAAGDPAFRAGMSKPMLDSVSQRLAPRLRQGYTAAFLGKLNQQGFAVYLWKLEFKDGRDDVLVTMALKDGKVGGFWLS